MLLGVASSDILEFKTKPGLKAVLTSGQSQGKALSQLRPLVVHLTPLCSSCEEFLLIARFFANETLLDHLVREPGKPSVVDVAGLGKPSRPLGTHHQIGEDVDVDAAGLPLVQAAAMQPPH